MISFKPSITWASSSGATLPIFLPIRPVESVRIWLILTQERLGNLDFKISCVSGKPARCSWLVSATAITVPERSLNMSWLRIRTGRSPDCSRPTVGLSAAHRISPPQYFGHAANSSGNPSSAIALSNAGFSFALLCQATALQAFKLLGWLDCDC